LIFPEERARPLVIGHRGAPVAAPANTLESFGAAVAAGADGIELDVAAGLVIAHSRREIPAQPLVLDEALEFVRESGVSVLIDLKSAGVERDVVEAVRRHGLVDHAFVSTTSALWLRRLAAADPGLTRSISYPNDRYRISRFAWPGAVKAGSAAAARAAMPRRVPLLLAAARATALTIHYRLVSGAVVAAARARGAPVVAWTVNDPAEVARLQALGVAGIITDDPKMALATMGA
jgi:glycerophosphoryl diester phosphodiesterase